MGSAFRCLSYLKLCWKPVCSISKKANGIPLKAAELSLPSLWSTHISNMIKRSWIKYSWPYFTIDNTHTERLSCSYFHFQVILLIGWDFWPWRQTCSCCVFVEKWPHNRLNQRYCMKSWHFLWPSKAQFCFLLYLECHTASHYCCCCRKVILLCASIINIKSNHNLFTSHNTLPKARTNLISRCQNLRAHILR